LREDSLCRADVFSGGIVYMYFNETNNYGVVQVKGDKANKMTNFKALAKQHAKADPKTVSMDSYKPANNPPSSCPAVSSSWKVSDEALPPVADSDLCECMAKSRQCVPKDSLDAEDYGDKFAYICENDEEGCKAINGQPSIGVYGAYSMCTPKQKLAYAMDSLYKKNGKKSDSCDFEGTAQLQKTSMADGCSDRLKEADDHNKQVATATQASDAPAQTGGSKKDDDEGAAIRNGPGLFMALAMGAAVALL
jgi:hypothetical protein